MGLTTNAYINKDDFTTGSYLACAVRIIASRSSSSSTKVTITCESHLGFGSHSDNTSHEELGVTARCWYGSSSWDSRSVGADATVASYGVDWKRSDGGVWTALSSTSGLTQKAYTPHKHNTFSFELSNWTKSSITIYYDVIGPNTHTKQSVSISCPDYYTNASVSMTTKTQTVNPGDNITFVWSGSAGTNNSISKYYLYYNGTAYDCSTNTSKTLPAPPANTTYSAYVKAKAAYNEPTSSTINITTRDYGTPTASISTSSQTLKPDTTLSINWSGSAGTANPISKYQLYYNDQKIYEGASTSYEIEAPPVDSSYIVYVNAVGTYGNKIGKSSDITISTAPYMWLMVSGVWKSVQSVYIYDDEWKEVDASDPLDVGVDNIWKGV